MCENLKTWNLVKQVPPNFLKPIAGGKLKGKSDINPQWRLMAMTQAFGMVGHGWNYRIVRTWSEQNTENGSVMCFAEVAVQTKLDGEWGKEFSGIGGSELIQHNKNGLQNNDDGYKMAVTDALSVALKAIGIAADIYLGNYDDSKYQYKQDLNQAFVEYISQDQANELKNIIGSKSENGRQIAMAELAKFNITIEQIQPQTFESWKGFFASLN